MIKVNGKNTKWVNYYIFDKYGSAIVDSLKDVDITLLTFRERALLMCQYFSSINIKTELLDDNSIDFYLEETPEVTYYMLKKS